MFLISYSLGIYVFLQNTKSAVYRLFILIMMAGVAERLASLLTLILKTSILSYAIRGVGDLTFLFLPPMYLHFSLVFPKKAAIFRKIRHEIVFLLGLYIPALVFFYLFLNIHNTHFQKVRLAFIIYETLYIALINYIFYSSYRKNSEHHERQKIFSAALGLNINIVFISMLTYQQVMYTQYADAANIIKLCSPAIIFIFVGFAILNFNMKNIFIIVRKSMLWATFMGFVLVFYVLVKKNIESAFGSLFREESWFVEGVAVVVIVFMFQPAKNLIVDMVNRIIREKREYLIQSLRDFSALSVNVLSLSELVQTIKNIVTDTFDCSVVDIAIISDEQEAGIFQESDRYIVLKTEKAQDSESIIEMLYEYKSKQYASVYPLSIKGRIIGALCIGEKKSGEFFTLEEIETISSLVNQISIAVENAIGYEQLKIANTALKHTVAELENTQHKLYEADKLASLGRMSASIAHEIRNPLGIIKLSAGKLETAISHEKHRKLARFIREEVDRLNIIVQELLDFSKKRTHSFETKNLKEVVKDCIDKFQKYPGVKLKTVKFDDVWANVDAESIYQVLLNIYINAVQAMEETGIVEFSVFSSAEKAIVEISDTGKGIDESNAGKVFEPFFTTKSRGTGLGLAIVKRIAEEHGGDITVKREQDKTVFTLFLKAVYNGEQNSDS